jgi:hypothetical protein
MQARDTHTFEVQGLAANAAAHRIGVEAAFLEHEEPESALGSARPWLSQASSIHKTFKFKVYVSEGVRHAQRFVVVTIAPLEVEI